MLQLAVLAHEGGLAHEVRLLDRRHREAHTGGVGLVRGGAGTSLVGSHAEVADLIRQYRDVGFDDFVLSGYPCLEEAYWFGEGVRPRVEALPTEEHSHDRAVS